MLRWFSVMWVPCFTFLSLQKKNTKITVLTNNIPQKRKIHLSKLTQKLKLPHCNEVLRSLLTKLFCFLFLILIKLLHWLHLFLFVHLDEWIFQQERWHSCLLSTKLLSAKLVLLVSIKYLKRKVCTVAKYWIFGEKTSVLWINTKYLNTEVFTSSPVSIHRRQPCF